MAGGSYHDFSLLQKDFPLEQNWFEDLELWVDLGYQGIHKKYQMKEVKLPHKKPRSSKNNPTTSLTLEQKQENKAMSSFRVAVENAIAGMKRYNILVQKFRNKSQDFADDMIEICAGLWNFKLSFKKQNYC